MSDINDQVGQIIESVKDSFQKVGLYANDVQFAVSNPEALIREDDPNYTPDMHKLIASGDAQFVATVRFDIGDVAWSDRILNPEKYDLDKEFEAIVPKEDETAASQLAEMMRRFEEE